MRLILLKNQLIKGQQFHKSKFQLMFLFVSIFITNNLTAHGFVLNSRADSCTQAAGLNFDCGQVSSIPDYVLNRNGRFPNAGPIDGMLASAEVKEFSQLDVQTSNRWYKHQIPTGPFNFTWNFTVLHTTSDFNYYLTKPTWNPNQPLTRNSFNLTPFCVVEDIDMELPSTHTCEIPIDYSGYHVIYSIWNTSNGQLGFYQIIDVSIIGDSDFIFLNGFE